MGPNGMGPNGWTLWYHWMDSLVSLDPMIPFVPMIPLDPMVSLDSMINDIGYGLPGPKGSTGRNDQTGFKNTNEPDDNAGTNVKIGPQAWKFHIKIR